MKMYRKIALTLLALFVTQLAFSQSGILKGRLQDPKGNDIPYANVALLKMQDSVLVSGAVTDEQGAFLIPSPKKGSYFLRFSAIGYATTYSKPFENDGLDFSKDFDTIFMNEETAMLEEVSVKAMRPKVIVEAGKIVVSVEGTAMAAGSSAFDVLEKSPGVYVDQDANLQLNAKKGVEVMIDGRPTYLSAKALQTLLEGMSAENIKNIEIIANPSSKYDAEGTAGILNINLKKNTLTGINGSMYAGYQYIQLQGYSAGGNLNYKKGNWNSFANLDVAERPNYRDTEMFRQFNNNGYRTTIDQAGRNELIRFVPNLRLGTDYSLNENHRIGAIANISYHNKYKKWNTQSRITETDITKNLYLEAKNRTESKLSRGTFNLNYKGALDTTGTIISADFDYVKINSIGNAQFFNAYHYLDGGVESTLFNTENPSSFDIYSGKIDFEKPLSKNSKIEAGLKRSRVLSKNQLMFFQTTNEQKIHIDSMSNDFRYEEKIYAAYANLNHRFNDRWNLQAGLRVEKTNASGFSERMDEENPRNYLDFFPNIFIEQKVSKNYQLSYSYSRRITRPNYKLMNPSVFYLDPYTFVKGNPNMRPQYSQAFQVTQTLKQTYNLVLGYDYTTDFIAEVPEQDAETKQTFFSISNVDRFENISATLVAPIEILPVWSVNNNVVAAYQRYSTFLQEDQVQNNSFFLTAQSNHTIKLPKEIVLELNANYRSPIAYGVYKLETFWGVDAGIKRSFLKDKFEMSLNFLDIFRSKYVTGNANLQGNINAFNHYSGTRGFRLHLRYNFNKGEKFNTKNQKIELEELNRAGG